MRKKWEPGWCICGGLVMDASRRSVFQCLLILLHYTTLLCSSLFELLSPSSSSRKPWEFVLKVKGEWLKKKSYCMFTTFLMVLPRNFQDLCLEPRWGFMACWLPCSCVDITRLEETEERILWPVWSEIGLELYANGNWALRWLLWSVWSRFWARNGIGCCLNWWMGVTVYCIIFIHLRLGGASQW